MDRKMPRKHSNFGDSLLQHGLTLLSQEGLGGVTIGRLAEQVGISKSGVFAHFSSKTAVHIALLEHAAAIAGPLVIAPSMQEPAGLCRLRALVRNWLGWSGRAGLGGGCPVAAAMFELDDVEGPVRDKVLEMEARWRELLAGLVREAIATGELRADLDVDQLVWELCGVYLSHHVSTRFVRDPRADARGETAVEALIDRARARRAPGSTEVQ
jgi:AcrR family transcriptional regulator